MRIVVLNDGETFTDIADCEIVDVPDGLDTEDIEEFLRSRDGDSWNIEAVFEASGFE